MMSATIYDSAIGTVNMMNTQESEPTTDAKSDDKPITAKKRVRKHYAEDERPYKCEHCKRTYAFEHSRNQHVRLKHVKRTSSLGRTTSESNIRNGRRHSGDISSISAIKRTLGDIFKRGPKPYTRYNEIDAISFRNQLQETYITVDGRVQTCPTQSHGAWPSMKNPRGRSMSDVGSSHLTPNMQIGDRLCIGNNIIQTDEKKQTMGMRNKSALCSIISESSPKKFQESTPNRGSIVRGPPSLPSSWSRPKSASQFPRRPIDHVHPRPGDWSHADIIENIIEPPVDHTRKTLEGWAPIPHPATNDLMQISEQKRLRMRNSAPQPKISTITNLESSNADALGNDATLMHVKHHQVQDLPQLVTQKSEQRKEDFTCGSPNSQLQAFFGSMGVSISDSRSDVQPRPSLALTTDFESKTDVHEACTLYTKSKAQSTARSTGSCRNDMVNMEWCANPASAPASAYQGQEVPGNISMPDYKFVDNVENNRSIQLKPASELNIDMVCDILRSLESC